VEIVELELREDSPLCGLRLMELSPRLKAKVLVCAVERGDRVVIPDGRYQLQANDKLYVTAPADELLHLLRNLGIRSKKAKDAMIIGGSRITQMLAPMLLRSGTRVKIIESNPELAETLAEMLPGATIIRGDSFDQNILNEENISQMDTVVALTEQDGENLTLSMYASFLGIPQVITKLNRTEYNDVFRNRGVDCVISPKLLCAQNIVRYVRAMQNSSGSSVLAMHHLVNNRVEALEFLTTEQTKHLGETLSKIRLKPNILIACINRMGKIIIPGGSDTIEKGDTVIVVTAADRVILDLNDIFAAED